MNTPYMKIENLSIGYQEEILSGINLELFEGSFIPLLGPNGIGKTTFVKTLFGLIEKKSGTIELFGKKIEDYSIKERAGLIGLSLSEPLNTGLMTCYEFVALGILSNSSNPKNNEDEILGLFSKLDVKDLLTKQFNELSDGQKEWIKLIRVLVQKTKIIFLDEPMSHLDISGKVKMISVLKEHARETGTSILMSSHDWATIRKFSSWIYVIDQEGDFSFLTPEDLILNKKLNEIYPLQTHSMFEDHQGEISLKIETTFSMVINSDDDIKRFWLEHSLAKLGYSATHDNKMGRIDIKSETFECDEKSFASISELITHIKKLQGQ